MANVGVVLPCAGSGSRVGAARPKQFLDVGGKPVFHWSLECFLGLAQVREVVLVTSAQELDELGAQLRASDFGASLDSGRLRLVVGGSERWESVRNGVLALNAESSVVLVHDVARPFVTESVVQSVIDAAVAHGACTVALPCPDTVKWTQPSSTRVESTLDRRRVWLTQTPQGFQRSVLDACYEQLRAQHNVLFTDEASLAETFGNPVELVLGQQRLHKITTADDLEWARWFQSRASEAC